MPRSIDVLRPSARLQLAAHSAASAAQLATMADERDRPFGDRTASGRDPSGRAASERACRSGGPRAIGDALVQLFAQQRSYEEALVATPEPARAAAFRRPAPMDAAATNPELSLVVS